MIPVEQFWWSYSMDERFARYAWLDKICSDYDIDDGGNLRVRNKADAILYLLRWCDPNGRD